MSLTTRPNMGLAHLPLWSSEPSITCQRSYQGICIQLDNSKYMIAANEEGDQYQLYMVTTIEFDNHEHNRTLIGREGSRKEVKSVGEVTEI